MFPTIAWSLFFGCLGLLMIGIGAPLALERVPPNPFYGFRTKKTLSNPRIWYAVNRVSGFDFIIAGAIQLLTSLMTVALFTRANPETIFAILFSVYLLTIIGTVVHGFIVLRRM